MVFFLVGKEIVIHVLYKCAYDICSFFCIKIMYIKAFTCHFLGNQCQFMSGIPSQIKLLLKKIEYLVMAHPLTVTYSIRIPTLLSHRHLQIYPLG